MHRPRRMGTSHTRIEAQGAILDLVERHAIWQKAWSYLADGASIDVYDRDRPDGVWSLRRGSQGIALREGAAPDADLAIRVSEAALEHLLEVERDLGEALHRFLEAATERDAAAPIDVRVHASFDRMLELGYVSLLAAGGLRCQAFGALHGVRTLHDLRATLEKSRRKGPAHWEHGRTGASRAGFGDAGLRLRLRRVGREIAGQHKRLRELARTIQEALAAEDLDVVRDTAALYRDALAGHFELEERVVLPAIHGLAPHREPEIEGLLEDHARFFEEASELAEQDVGDAAWRTRFSELRRQLAVHEGEEEVLFRS